MVKQGGDEDDLAGAKTALSDHNSYHTQGKLSGKVGPLPSSEIGGPMTRFLPDDEPLVLAQALATSPVRAQPPTGAKNAMDAALAALG